MTRPARIQLSRSKGFNLQAASRALNGLPAIVVARPTKWGNPWRVGEPGIPGAAEAVRRFRAAILGFTSNGAYCPPQAHPQSPIGRLMRDAPANLSGHNLACWCPLDGPCHADVLLELANPPSPQGCKRERAPGTFARTDGTDVPEDSKT